MLKLYSILGFGNLPLHWTSSSACALSRDVLDRHRVDVSRLSGLFTFWLDWSSRSGYEYPGVLQTIIRRIYWLPVFFPTNCYFPGISRTNDNEWLCNGFISNVNAPWTFKGISDLSRKGRPRDAHQQRSSGKTLKLSIRNPPRYCLQTGYKEPGARLRGLACSKLLPCRHSPSFYRSVGSSVYCILLVLSRLCGTAVLDFGLIVEG